MPKYTILLEFGMVVKIETLAFIISWNYDIFLYKLNA